MTSSDNLIKSDMPSIDERERDSSSDDLMDETMKLISDYEEGLTPRDFKGMADCTCGIIDSESGEHQHNHESK